MSSSSLGKRKEREDDTVKEHSSTLFVSNLPYTVTSTDLQTFFSDIAPIRSAFIVTEHGTGVSKGVGYVSFALKQDAESAYQKIFNEGLTLVGRRLRVEWAERKQKDVKDKPLETEVKPTRSAPSYPRSPHDPLAIRTVIISGLDPSIGSKALWKKMRKFEGVENVVWPVKLDNESKDPTTAHVQFAAPALAQTAVDRLHAHVFKGRLLSATLKKRLDSLSKTAQTLDNSSKVAAPSRASRLIVRNLPFDATEQDLRAIFLPYGPIHSIHIPAAPESSDSKQEPGKPGTTRTRGFAFVWMLSKKDAEKAIEGCNGMMMTPGMAEGIVSDKQKRKKQRRDERKMKAAQSQPSEEQDELDGGTDDKGKLSRVIAVDWALSKEKWNEERAKLRTGTGSEAEGDTDTSGSEESASEEDLNVHQASDSEDGSHSVTESEANHEQPVKPQLPPPDEGTTLFIRNLPFDATEDELRTLFRTFGPLRYARITVDPSTGRSRGTGFVCFWNRGDADKVITQSELLRAETVGSVTSPPKKNPFTMHSILTPDPSSSLAQSLLLHGRTLDVVRAVTRDVANKLKSEGEKKREKADKRNLYLLKEGVILPNSPTAETISPEEAERRTSSYNARKALLRSNPSLYISKTRLSVRQIPTFVTERLLKRLALHAIHAFESEVLDGLRTGLSEDELNDLPHNEDEAGTQNDDKRIESTRKTRCLGVKQAKLVRQLERVDPITGKGRSKGYGFIEMHTHDDALRVLRWANNNPAVMKLFGDWWKDEVKDLIKREQQSKERDEARLKRMREDLEKPVAKGNRASLIVEFSIENIQVVRRRTALQKEKTPEHPVKRPRKTIGLQDSEVQMAKRQRVDIDKSLAKPSKLGSRIGSLIGRKRKARKLSKNV